MNLTVLLGQTGKPNPDTSKCYGLTELKYIAISLTEGKACDTLLSTAKEKIIIKDSIIKEKNLQISKYLSEGFLKDKQISDRDDNIKTLNKAYDKEVSRHNWTKFGWGSTTVVLGVTILYLIFH